MTTTTIQGPPLALDPATRATLLQTIVDSLPPNPNASDAERTALRDAALALLGALAPTDPVEAMLAAQVIGAHFACMNAYRCAARPDLPPALQVRYQAQAAALSRLTTSKRRELLRHQAAQPTLPAGFAAAHAAQAQATAQGAPARPATPAPRPAAGMAQRVAEVMASQDAQAAAAKRRPAAAAAPPPADDEDLAVPTEAEIAAVVAGAQALLAELAPPPADLGARLQAEVAARTAAAATQLAA